MQKLIGNLVILLVCLSPFFSIAETENWQSLVIPGSEFKYTLPGSELPADWTSVNFDDTEWTIGKSSIGYGDDDDETIISNTASVFMRHTFSVADLSVIEKLLLHMDYDDGFVAYI
ncbi:MAG: hypothetical protein WBA74_24590, partial [Cyclobacteriaceae bacterium]